ncbi:TetR family transcriptional regulator [Tepidamorphus gemmatus]|uniref:TetR family transcriptional regulator n=1 Tax=Tepidamorphus gemmatus TaxID=747076 RepID=A0A4R3LWN6_9HYPH|nr:TetR/AcrR family transcriptional regulator [Tepidamorphus gemmatus]TCT04169.1 TetR family transcriptional regulator [Tepidamorphus gemmatus]
MVRSTAAAHADPAAPSAETGFAAVLERAAADATKKTDRTRLRLMAALAAELAERAGPSGLRVASVTARAGLAHGTFYRYFTDMDSALEALIAAFAAHVRDTLAAARAGEPGSRVRVHAATLAYARLFRANAALMRCLIGLAGDGTASGLAWRELNRAWNLRMAAAIARRRAGDGPVLPAETFLPVASALGGMIDAFLTELHLRGDPELQHLRDDDEAVADLLTDLWCAGADGGRPAAAADAPPASAEPAHSAVRRTGRHVSPASP